MPVPARRPTRLQGFGALGTFDGFDGLAAQRGFGSFGDFLGAELHGFASTQGFGSFDALAHALSEMPLPPSTYGMDPRLDGLWGTIKKGAKAVGKGVGKAASVVAKGAVAVGKGAAAVGKGAVSVVGKVVDVLGLPSPADYDPERLIVIGLTDPVKYAVLLGAATIVVPGLGTAYVSGFALPQAIATGFPMAVAKAYARGGWDQVIRNILDPIVDDLGSKAQFVIDYALNGNSALARWAVKKVAAKLPANVIKGVLLAVAESVAVVDAVRKPGSLKEESTFISLAELMKKVGSSGVLGHGGGASTAVTTAGEVVHALAPAISILLKQGPGGLGAAVESTSRRVLGFSPSDIQALPEIARREFVKAKLAAARSIGFSGAFSDAQAPISFKLVDNLSRALSDVAAALNKLPWGVGKIITGALKDVQAMVAQVKGFYAQAQQLAAGAGTPGQVQAPVALPSSPTATSAPTSSTSATPAPAQMAPTPIIRASPRSMPPASAQKLALTPALLAAGGGMVVAGPLGAILAGGAGLLFAAIKKG